MIIHYRVWVAIIVFSPTSGLGGARRLPAALAATLEELRSATNLLARAAAAAVHDPASVGVQVRGKTQEVTEEPKSWTRFVGCFSMEKNGKTTTNDWLNDLRWWFFGCLPFFEQIWVGIEASLEWWCNWEDITGANRWEYKTNYNGHVYSEHRMRFISSNII